MSEEPTTPSKKKPNVCRLCGNNFDSSRNKHHLIIKDVKQDYAVVLEELTATEVSVDDEVKAVCGQCRTKLNAFRRCQQQQLKLADEIKDLFLRNQAARVKRCAKSTPERGREKKKTREQPSPSPGRARRNLFEVPTCVVSVIYISTQQM